MIEKFDTQLENRLFLLQDNAFKKKNAMARCKLCNKFFNWDKAPRRFVQSLDTKFIHCPHCKENLYGK